MVDEHIALRGPPKSYPGRLTYYEYLSCVYRLGLTPCSKRLAEYTGLSVRQLQRIYNHHAPVPASMSRLLSLSLAVVGLEVPRFAEFKRDREAAEMKIRPQGYKPTGRPDGRRRKTR
jgi:hypothetical protein